AESLPIRRAALLHNDQAAPLPGPRTLARDSQKQSVSLHTSGFGLLRSSIASRHHSPGTRQKSDLRSYLQCSANHHRPQPFRQTTDVSRRASHPGAGSLLSRKRELERPDQQPLLRVVSVWYDRLAGNSATRAMQTSHKPECSDVPSFPWRLAEYLLPP